MAEKNQPIVTFYSYKGGVGRSMVVANVAWLLANEFDMNVLVVDWDLEAPGLHRFFGIEPQDVSLGCIDLLDEYKSLMKSDSEPLPSPLIDIDKYLIETTSNGLNSRGSLSLIAAGKQDELYPSRVTEFDWGEFYEKWHGYGFIEFLKQQLKAKADIVLVDSRTGVSDIGGICTLQLPDIVVLLFALNEQNISGTEFVAENILKRSSEFSERTKPPELIVRAARVEKYLEQDKKNEWEGKASRRLRKYLPEENQASALRFVKESALPYVGAYSFGEMPLAVQKNRYDEPAVAFEALTISILKVAGLWNPSLDSKITREKELSDKQQLRLTPEYDQQDSPFPWQTRKRYFRIFDVFGTQYVYGALLFNVLFVILGVALHEYGYSWFKVALIAVIGVFVVFLEYYFKRSAERQKLISATETFLREILETTASSILQIASPPIRHIRVSIMVPDRESRLLKIAFSYNFAPTDQDSQIRIPIGTGAAGQAWIQQKAMVADLTSSSTGLPEGWGLPASEWRKVRPTLRSIISVPILAGEDHHVIGILNFDSDNAADDMGFKDAGIQQLVFNCASSLAQVLETGNYSMRFGR